MVNRIKSVINYSGLSVRAFAGKIGLNQPSLDRMLKGVNALNLSCTSAVLTTFPEISAEWLMRGEGGMLKPSGEPQPLLANNNLVDVISTLQGIINEKEAALAAANDRIKQLESKLEHLSPSL